MKSWIGYLKSGNSYPADIEEDFFYKTIPHVQMVQITIPLFQITVSQFQIAVPRIQMTDPRFQLVGYRI